MSRFSSRKFLVLFVEVLLIILVPLIYKAQDIGEGVMLAVIGAVAAAGSAYVGFNVLQKKIESKV